MDTTTSPNRTSASNRSSKVFSIALTAGVGLWLTAMATDMASAEPARPEPVNQQSTPVSFGDLDLSTQYGAKTLIVRISKAAKMACGELTHSALLPRESAYHRQCVAEAVDAAVSRIGSPTLTALYRSQPDLVLAAR